VQALWGRDPNRLSLLPLVRGTAATQARRFLRGADVEERRALRVSRYLPEERVRFGVWEESGTARAAVTLEDEEAVRLAAFLTPRATRSPSILDELRAFLGR